MLWSRAQLKAKDGCLLACINGSRVTGQGRGPPCQGAHSACLHELAGKRFQACAAALQGPTAAHADKGANKRKYMGMASRPASLAIHHAHCALTVVKESLAYSSSCVSFASSSFFLLIINL